MSELKYTQHNFAGGVFVASQRGTIFSIQRSYASNVVFEQTVNRWRWNNTSTGQTQMALGESFGAPFY